MTGPSIYDASDTGQMREAGAAAGFRLDIHELRDDGLPVCGPKPDSWQGKNMALVELGPGSVTCKSCAKITRR